MNIWIAASDGKIPLVDQLLQQNYHGNANVKDPNGYTPVHAAAAYGHIDLLRKLCKQYGGDINIKDVDGDTPLHHCEDPITAKVIVEELGGDTTLTNGEGKTALQAVEEDGEFPELIQYLRVQGGMPANEDSLGIDAEQLAQFKDSIRYTIDNEPAATDDPEFNTRRQRVEEILRGENAEQELESYIREIVRAQADLHGSRDEPMTKRRK
ncbi:YCR051W [Zygosaccharomyces parabailii]|nr:YCR051W [Zygosaccharomyces parabailii]CDH10994.1 related to Ankyrin repeat-containing protein YCR051W [Zygosaccharomyces bailii ISA1307]